MPDPCPTCGRSQGYARPTECLRGIYDVLGPSDERDCERAGRLRAEATVAHVRALLDVAYAACNDAYPCYDKAVVDAIEAALLACGAKMVAV